MTDKTPYYKHNPNTLQGDIKLVENLKGTYDMDSSAFYEALDNILRFVKWAHLGTDGSLKDDR